MLDELKNYVPQRDAVAYVSISSGTTSETLSQIFSIRWFICVSASRSSKGSYAAWLRRDGLFGAEHLKNGRVALNAPA